ncbi:hypothetical protein BJX63DRAFT_411145 [Aspergillus granulosus]|uniref:Uncharacterized protein n=1 Tax=Aspergillus granulosus TaxID=176169 RepID=A0ABR4GYW5_9EURO
MELEPQEQLSLATMGEAASRQFALLSESMEVSNQRRFIDQQQRYETWASSLGLYHLGHSSLDYRFRDSPPLFEYASGLLADLNRALLMLTDMFTAAPSAEDISIVEYTDDEAVSDESEEDFSSYQTEALDQEYIKSISITIDRLYALSFRIRNPKMRTGLSRALGYTEIDPESGVNLIDAYRNEDLRHIIELFKIWRKDVVNEESFLVQRLAQANTHRRQQFKYWGKRKAQYDNYHPNAIASQVRRVTLVRLRGSETDYGPARPSEPSTATHLDPGKLDDTESAISTDSFVITGDDTNETIAIPPPPEIDPTSSEAECPYCYIICSKATFGHRAWRRHIMRDLRPYICTFEHCKEADQQYDTFTEWISHEINKHDVDPNSLRFCPFCSLSNVNTNHIAHHLRRVASFSLPRDRDDTEPAGSQVGSTHSINITSGSERVSDVSASDHGWDANKKSITFILDNSIEIVAEVSPVGESLETLITPLLKEHWPSDVVANPTFRFLDQNRNVVPLDYDSVYDTMRVNVEFNEYSKRIQTQPAHPMRVSTQGDLDSRYTVQEPGYFEPGKVFSILWHENDGRAGRAGGTHVSVGPSFRDRYNEPIYSTIRRLVVFRAFDNYSWCFSISTYGGRGLAKPGLDPSKHAIIYMTGTHPKMGSMEPLMSKGPLEVDPDRFDDPLDRMSRVNFGRIYTVEHDVKVLGVGKISPQSMPRFIAYARAELAL